MSRDSSFGVTGLKVDSKSSMNKSLDDDSITNEKYQKQYSKRRKFVDDSEDEQEPSELQFKIKKRR